MAAYANIIGEPDVRAALALNAWEENRHKEVLMRAGKRNENAPE